MVCGNFILPEPASYVFFYALFNLRKLLYITCESDTGLEIDWDISIGDGVELLIAENSG